MFCYTAAASSRIALNVVIDSAHRNPSKTIDLGEFRKYLTENDTKHGSVVRVKRLQIAACPEEHTLLIHQCQL